jgi:hypothetical protein
MQDFLSFLRGEVGDFAFLGRYASSVISSLPTFGTTYCFHFQKSSSPKRKTAWPIIMGLTFLLETLVINDELWVKSRSLLRIYKPAVNSSDNKRRTKCRKYRMDCFFFSNFDDVTKQFFICQVKFRHAYICKQNFWRNVGWWYTVCRRFETCEDLRWY